MGETQTKARYKRNFNCLSFRKLKPIFYKTVISDLASFVKHIITKFNLDGRKNHNMQYQTDGGQMRATIF
jgi:hypothetical protein